MPELLITMTDSGPCSSRTGPAELAALAKKKDLRRPVSGPKIRYAARHASKVLANPLKS